MPLNDFGSSQNMPPPRRVGTAPFNGVSEQEACQQDLQQPAAIALPHKGFTQQIVRHRLRTLMVVVVAARTTEGHTAALQHQRDRLLTRSRSSSVDDLYDSYYDGPGVNDSDPRNQYGAEPARSSYPDFQSAPADPGRGSFDQSMRPATEQTQPGAHGMPRLHHAKSEANFH